MENKNKKIIGIVSSLLVIVLSVFFLYKGNKTNPKEDLGGVGETEEIQDDEATVSDVKWPSFKLKDLEGNEVTNEVFTDYELTIIPIWQSSCSPCITELEALNEIYKQYKDEGVNILGIALDGEVNEGGVNKVIELTELEFVNIVPDEDYMYELIELAQSTPTAFFIDKDGNFAMKPKIGTSGKDGDIEEFKAIIEKLTSSHD